jgi:hypothetical protein
MERKIPKRSNVTMVSIQHVPEVSHLDSSLHHFHGITACDHCAACPPPSCFTGDYRVEGIEHHIHGSMTHAAVTQVIQAAQLGAAALSCLVGAAPPGSVGVLHVT